MKLKIVENYDADFTLDREAKAKLFQLLNSGKFRQQISQHMQGTSVEFTELIFQPVPYSINTPRGMPPEFEPYHNSPEYAIVNVPPNFMFQAKIFKPSRLCAIYRQLQ